MNVDRDHIGDGCVDPRTVFQNTELIFKLSIFKLSILGTNGTRKT